MSSGCSVFGGYVGAMAEAVGEDGVDVRGYLAWSQMEYVAFSPFSSFFFFLFSKWGHCGCIWGKKLTLGQQFRVGGWVRD